MGIFFGKPKKKKKPSTQSHVSEKDRAILELKRQRDRLKKYQIQLNSVIDRETAIARDLLKRGLKSRAVLALKKKKYQQSLVEKTDGELLNVEQLVNSIEFAAMQSNVFKALENGNSVLQSINSEISLDDVEKLMDETAEAIEYQNQISAMLGEELTEEDNYAVEAEYAALEAMMAEEEHLQMPDAPTTKPVVEDTTTTTTVEEDDQNVVASDTKKPVVVLSG